MDSEKRQQPDANGGAGFPIVGIGASAGGLQALRALFDAMPSDSGMAFVVIQHLDPTHESHMASLLQSNTAMPVIEVREPMVVVPDHVYMILPDSDLVFEGNQLQLRKPSSERAKRRPVDIFLTSLAEEQCERAVGVILSGTGSNGTPGLQAIKAHGGIAIAQDPATAGHTGMPQSAIGAGVVDHVLPVEQIPDKLLDYARHSYVRSNGADTNAPQRDGDEFAEILALLQSRAHQDFRAYKQSTLARRIHRRMGLHGIEELGRYADFVRERPDEIDALAQDLRIGVTAFFRDPESWQALREQAIRLLVQEREPGVCLRAWVPGCASGEEAYSLAIALVEEAEAQGKYYSLQIFASDSSDKSLNTGRAGWFPEAVTKGLSEEQLNRFFHKEGDGYRVNRQLRDAVTFASHDLLRDPPFSQIDLVSCRNLLIYLEADVQRRALSLLHFALCEGGYLFLGSAETIGREGELFQTVSRHHRIYRATGAKRIDSIAIPPTGSRDHSAGPHGSTSDERSRRGPSRATEVAERTLMEHFVPASVLVDSRHVAHYFHGPTELYLAQPGGEPTHNLLELARPDLVTGLRHTLGSASRNDAPAVGSGRVQRGEHRVPVRISVTPVRPSRDEEPMLLVSFQDAETGVSGTQTAPQLEESSDQRATNRELEHELRSTQQELHSSIKDLETSNEELKASNEEVSSMNEELQATNEELESSKEELQSLNEELSTVNAQLQSKVDELERSNNDLNNLLANTDVATLHLDSDFRIRWLTRAAKELLEAIDADIGRPISQLADKFSESHLLADARSVLDDLTPQERVIQDQHGRWYRRRIQPYRTQADQIDGVVVTFAEVTGLKERESALEHGVAERTAELEQTVNRLRQLTAELNTTEQRERRKIATTLHDDVQQLLVAAKMKLSDARRLTEQDKAAARVDDSINYIDQSVESMRTLAAELSPPLIYTEGIVPAIRRLAERVHERHGLQAVVAADESAGSALSDDLRAFTYQSIRELIFNVVKHADTSHAQIEVGDDAEYLSVAVADDGKGCAPDAIMHHGGGLGITSIRERLIGLGGDFELKANSDRGGCRVIMHVPLDREEPPCSQSSTGSER